MFVSCGANGFMLLIQCIITEGYSDKCKNKTAMLFQHFCPFPNFYTAGVGGKHGIWIAFINS